MVAACDETVYLTKKVNSLKNEVAKMAEELARYKELFQVLADWSTNWIFWESPAGEILYVSPAASRISGYSTEELKKQGKHFTTLIHPEDQPLWRKHQREAGRGESTCPLDIRILTKMGETRWLTHSCQPVLGESGKFLGLRGSLVDITERKQIEEQLRFMSNRDSLTGLYSRGFFMNELDRLIKGRIFPVTLVMADLDGLKEVNDSLGHAAGDALIRQSARLFQKIFRTDDVVARIGGDEFAVLMPGMAETAATQILHRFRRLEAEYNQDRQTPRIAFSIGMYTANDPKSLAAALERADVIMYRDKEQRKTNETKERETEEAGSSRDREPLPNNPA